MTHLPEIFAVSCALTFATVWLLGTFWSRCMDHDHLRSLPPVKRPVDFWSGK